MKKNIPQKITMIWLILATVLLFSCTSGSEELPDSLPTDDSTTSTDGIFTLKASITDNEGHDITTRRSFNKVSLFVFDQDNRFYDRLEIDIQSIIDQQDIHISCPGSSQITVIAWGSSTDLSEVISNLTKGSPMSDFMLNTSRSNSSNLPGDLFYGQVVILKGSNRSSATVNKLIMKRKNSSISLSTKGIDKEAAYCYTYKVRSADNGFNYNGVLTGDDIEYTIPAYFDDKGNLRMQKSSVLPSSAITIELYKDNEPVFNIQKDEHQNDLSVKEGSEIQIELVYNATVSVKTTILPWTYISQDIEF